MFYRLHFVIPGEDLTGIYLIFKEPSVNFLVFLVLDKKNLCHPEFKIEG
jgi:hypothetical protein